MMARKLPEKDEHRQLQKTPETAMCETPRGFFDFEECKVVCMEANPACEKAKCTFMELGPEACMHALDAIANGYLGEYGEGLLKDMLYQYDLENVDLMDIDCSAQTSMDIDCS